MILHVLGRLIRIEILPRPVRVARRWDGSAQATPVTTVARVGYAFRSLSRMMSLTFATDLPRRRRPDYLRRHL